MSMEITQVKCVSIYDWCRAKYEYDTRRMGPVAYMLMMGKKARGYTIIVRCEVNIEVALICASGGG